MKLLTVSVFAAALTAVNAAPATPPNINAQGDSDICWAPEVRSATTSALDNMITYLAERGDRDCETVIGAEAWFATTWKEGMTKGYSMITGVPWDASNGISNTLGPQLSTKCSNIAVAMQRVRDNCSNNNCGGASCGVAGQVLVDGIMVKVWGTQNWGLSVW